MKVLLPTIKQGYTSLLAESIEACGPDISFFEFESKEFALRAIVKSIEKEDLQVDVIHLHWAHYYCYADSKIKNFLKRRLRSIQLSIDNLVQIKRLQSLGCKVVWTVHNSLSHDAKFPISEYIFRRGLSVLCDDIIAMSNYSRSAIRENYGREHRVHVIPHGHFIGVIPNKVDKETARQKLGIPLESKVLLNFGLMRKYKGIDDLLNAFYKLDYPNIVLLLAGNCPDKKLKILIEEAAQNDQRIIHDLKFIADENIQFYVNASDWCIFPFKKILNSGSVLLALSMQRPVIVSNKGGIPEIVENLKNGLVYDCDKDLYAAILEALTLSDAHYKAIVREAIESIKSYSWPYIAQQHLEVYLHRQNDNPDDRKAKVSNLNCSIL